MHDYRYGGYDWACKEFTNHEYFFHTYGEFMMCYGRSLQLNAQYKEAILVLLRAQTHENNMTVQIALGNCFKELKRMNEAERAYLRAEQMIPARFYPLYLRAKLYEHTGQRKKMMQLAKRILNKTVKIPSRAIDEIREEMKELLNDAKLKEKSLSVVNKEISENHVPLYKHTKL